jgi:hypothetical protein
VLGSPRAPSGAGGLEELDRVARRVLEQDLLAARAADDVVAERQAGGAQLLDVGGDVLNDEVEPVPTGRRTTPGREIRSREGPCGA